MVSSAALTPSVSLSRSEAVVVATPGVATPGVAAPGVATPGVEAPGVSEAASFVLPEGSAATAAEDEVTDFLFFAERFELIATVRTVPLRPLTFFVPRGGLFPTLLEVGHRLLLLFLGSSAVDGIVSISYVDVHHVIDLTFLPR